MKHQERSKLHRQYQALSDEEKIRRLEILAKYYLGLATEDADFVVDATKYWTQFELLHEEGNV